MAIRFEICTVNDLETLKEIARTTFITAFKEDNNPDDFKEYITSAFSENQLKSELLNPNCTFYFAYLLDDLVGYFKLNEEGAQNETFEKSSIELERIYVLEAFQNQQIGMRLVLKLIEITKSKKVEFLWLGVWEKNVAALRFYKRYGFKKFSTHAYYIGTDKQIDWLLKLASN